VLSDALVPCLDGLFTLFYVIRPRLKPRSFSPTCGSPAVTDTSPPRLRTAPPKTDGCLSRTFTFSHLLPCAVCNATTFLSSNASLHPGLFLRPTNEFRCDILWSKSSMCGVVRFPTDPILRQPFPEAWDRVPFDYSPLAVLRVSPVSVHTTDFVFHFLHPFARRASFLSRLLAPL